MAKTLEEKLNENMIMFRGTVEEIKEKLNSFNPTTNKIEMERFEEEIPTNDIGYNFSFGEDDEGEYLDFEIFMLPTRAKDNFIVTELSSY